MTLHSAHVHAWRVHMAKADLKRRGLYLPTTKRKWRTGVGFVAMARVTDIRRSKVA